MGYDSIPRDREHSLATCLGVDSIAAEIRHMPHNEAGARKLER